MTAAEIRLANGKCKLCDSPKKPFSKLCKDHAAQAVQAGRELFQKRKAAGECTVCGVQRGNNSTETMCDFCAESMRIKAALRKARRKAAGQCRQCPNKIAVGKSKVFCLTCLEKHRKRYKKK